MEGETLQIISQPSTQRHDLLSFWNGASFNLSVFPPSNGSASLLPNPQVMAEQPYSFLWEGSVQKGPPSRAAVEGGIT